MFKYYEEALKKDVEQYAAILRLTESQECILEALLARVYATGMCDGHDSCAAIFRKEVADNER